MADKFIESLNIENNIFELTENCTIKYLVNYYCFFTGSGEHEMPAGTKFCLHGLMRDDAMYMHIVEENDDNLYNLLSEKEKKKIPELAERFAGISFFIAEEQLSVLPLRFISGSRERSLEILKLIRQYYGDIASNSLVHESRDSEHPKKVIKSNMGWKRIIQFFLLLFIVIVVVKSFKNVLRNNESQESGKNQDLNLITTLREEEYFMQAINTIEAHDERDTIVGNFTGGGIDTLYVETIVDKNLDRYMATMYYMTSTNHQIPRIEIHGFPGAPPKLVNEGDLDGNGTTDVGYLHTWMNSQWRYYRILTLVKNEWRNLVDGDYLDTPQWFRDSGVEVAEPGPKKGTILIHHYHEEYDDDNEEFITEIRDTIVNPTFSEITEVPENTEQTDSL